ncbi:ataxin-3 isoform X1 [Callorhinchus milii]|uniref:ubiquitinyl hydrolase 1 n=1 Tax=Callorhinchus milii TaxID=7868 RepID=V9KVJ1_CALMI|nr:ataxin-3 isoform X1 [Callorhinchus milii]|eukprot:gi/632971166/ref/XP_007902038.1/ PREDICTED: ataxin-3 [Callorhinchus milii]
MEAIFHEKQEGSLCAQHCLNNLLQGEYFSPVELSSIAQQLDEEERARMAEGGTATEEYKIFLQQPSGNMDDSGFFSIQVISSALGVWGLELTLFNSPEYQRLRIDAVNERAFICNYKEHWFTVRKLGNQWFNLNSLLMGPELISDTYLALFLAQLQQEGYSIFVLRGDLPECEADELLKIMRVVQQERPKLIGEEGTQRTQTESSPSVQNSDWEQTIDASKSVTSVVDEDDENLQRALSLSRQHMETEDEEADLRRAIHLSMQGFGQGTEITEVTSNDVAQSSGINQISPEELRRRRQDYFEKKQPCAQPSNSNQPEKPGCTALRVNSASVTERETPQADVNKSLDTDANDNSKEKGS